MKSKHEMITYLTNYNEKDNYNELIKVNDISHMCLFTPNENNFNEILAFDKAVEESLKKNLNTKEYLLLFYEESYEIYWLPYGKNKKVCYLTDEQVKEIVSIVFENDTNLRCGVIVVFKNECDKVITKLSNCFGVL